MLITAETGIKESVQKYPKTAAVFMEFGMGCLGCAAAHFENIEQGAVVHGIDVPALLEALNKAAEQA
jgi:hybrid cluster-associated redox disulfide protein